ncbi:MAG: hypothetical protein ACR2PL_08495, partial [Dehalococcoidia bacterium]
MAVGGPPVNTLRSHCKEHGSTWEYAGDCGGAYLEEQAPRIALWGWSSRQTWDAVSPWIDDPPGLRRLLQSRWGGILQEREIAECYAATAGVLGSRWTEVLP